MGIGTRHLIVQALLLAALALPLSGLRASAQNLTGRAGLLVGGGASKRWEAAQRTVEGSQEWWSNVLTFFSDGTFMASRQNTLTSGHWSLSADGSRLFLFDRASGNLKVSDTLALSINGLSSTLLALRWSEGGKSIVADFRPAGFTGSKAKAKKKNRKRRRSK
jgi:hypothetical protein